MTHALNLHDGTGVLVTLPGEGIMFAIGDTVPTDASAGYGDSALFLQTDGGAGTGLYINEGSNTSCDFNAVVSGAELAFLSGVTAGTAAVSKALVLNSSGDITLVDGSDLALGGTTGTKIGTSATAQKLGFFNATPVVQRVGAAGGAVVTTATTQVTPYGFATQAQGDNLVALANEIRAALVEIGLMKGAA